MAATSTEAKPYRWMITSAGAVIVGAVVSPTVAEVVPAGEVQPFTVAVTLYVPVAAVVALGIVGFWAAEVKPLGPVHAYVASATVEANKLKVEPGQTTPPLLAVGAEGMALTVA